jgi:hypothetical protein
MKSNMELNFLNLELNEMREASQSRAAVLLQLKGLKYWLYLFGL